MRALDAARWLAIMASLVIRGVAGQEDDPNHGVVFAYPTTDQLYNLMDTVNVTYTSPFPTPDLYTFCDGGNRQVSMQRAPSYNATVPIVLNFTSATPCWFNLRPGTEAGFGANSPSFTIIGQERASGRRVFGPELSPTITLPPYTPSGPGGTNPTETESGNDPSEPGKTDNVSGSALSTGATAGIGVGAAVGALAIAAGVFLWWRRKRAQERSQPNLENGNGQGGSTGQALQDDKRYVFGGNIPSGSAQNLPSELGATDTPAELASSAAPGLTMDHQTPRYEMAA
ncbi:hypothetical protein V8F20_002834 [Naviculisporaceae sp. PSN 640]